MFCIGKKAARWIIAERAPGGPGGCEVDFAASDRRATGAPLVRAGLANSTGARGAAPPAPRRCGGTRRRGVMWFQRVGIGEGHAESRQWEGIQSPVMVGVIRGVGRRA